MLLLLLMQVWFFRYGWCENQHSTVSPVGEFERQCSDKPFEDAAIPTAENALLNEYGWYGDIQSWAPDDERKERYVYDILPLAGSREPRTGFYLYEWLFESSGIWNGGEVNFDDPLIRETFKRHIREAFLHWQNDPQRAEMGGGRMPLYIWAFPPHTGDFRGLVANVKSEVPLYLICGAYDYTLPCDAFAEYYWVEDWAKPWRWNAEKYLLRIMLNAYDQWFDGHPVSFIPTFIYGFDNNVNRVEEPSDEDIRWFISSVKQLQKRGIFKSPPVFQKHLFVTSFDEINEGTAAVPTREYGYHRLNILKEALDE